MQTGAPLFMGRQLAAASQQPGSLEEVAEWHQRRPPTPSRQVRNASSKGGGTGRRGRPFWETNWRSGTSGGTPSRQVGWHDVTEGGDSAMRQVMCQAAWV